MQTAIRTTAAKTLNVLGTGRYRVDDPSVLAWPAAFKITRCKECKQPFACRVGTRAKPRRQYVTCSSPCSQQWNDNALLRLQSARVEEQFGGTKA